MVKSIDREAISYTVIPDQDKLIQKELLKMCDELRARLVITAGGTGLGPRDVTRDATLGVIEKEVPGVSEAMRVEGFKSTPMPCSPGQSQE